MIICFHLPKGKVVFQLVGKLSRPTLISHVGNRGQRTIFDFRTEQVFFSEERQWMAYKAALAVAQYKDWFEQLIRDWDGLRWKAHLMHKKKAKKKL